MRFRAALAGGLLAAELCLGAAFCLATTGLSGPITNGAETGTAYVTQTGYNSREYDTTFGDNWESVRTFHLLTALDKPLKIYINERPANGSQYQPQYRQYVLDSLREWSNALDGRLKYTLTNKSREADITVNWVPSFDDRYVAGVTNYSVGHADVEIKTVGVPEKDIKCNIMHEFGHALGIAGHSSNPDDIMVGVRRWHRDNTPYNPTLSRHDVQAIRHLYSLAWRKGEDLYSAAAQSAPAFYSPIAAGTVMGKQAEQTAVVVQANGDSAVVNWAVAPQTSRVNPPRKPAPGPLRFLQIYPTH